MKFTPEQSRKYYESRVDKFYKNGTSWMALCPFHKESNPSCAFDFVKGTYFCHTCGIGGGMVDFEAKFNHVSQGEARAAIGAVLGLSDYQFPYQIKPEAIYDYTDEQGRLLYQVIRTRDARGNKRISNRRPMDSSKWEYNLDGVRRVLYRLPEVLRADQIYIVEGEKCVEAIREAAGGEARLRELGLAVTTNSGGAGKWRDEFAPYFTGKKVVVIPDNNVVGKDHMQQVAASVGRYALGIKWLDLARFFQADKDDVYDFLYPSAQQLARGYTVHNFDELVSLTRKAPLWKPANGDSGLLVPANGFIRGVSREVEWRVEGVIEKGTSGFVIALPKSGKSFAVSSLAVSLASGRPWMGQMVPEPTRTAIVSREDASSLTARRLKRAMIGIGMDSEDPIWESNLLINTRSQSPTLMIDNEKELNELINYMKQKKIEFCILDVLNVLHDADENDNTEMRRVLAKVMQIRKEVGCQICIVHHSVKDWDDTRTLSQLVRGSSAIAGFAEFIIGIRMVDKTEQVRQMMFETKSAEPLPPFYWKILDQKNGSVILDRVEYEEKSTTIRNKLATLVPGGR